MKRKRELLAEREQSGPSAKGIPTYGDAALSVLGGGRESSAPAKGEEEAVMDEVSDNAGGASGRRKITRTERKREPETRARTPKKPLFSPDPKAPLVNKTTKLREDQHRALKDDVPAWVARAYPEHPNLKRLVTIEFLVQMAVDELLTDEKLVERVVGRIQKACVPS